MMDRHSFLYQQGLASIKRKIDSIKLAQEVKDESELKECLFAPVLVRKRLTPMNTPKLYQNTVQRLRKGIADRDRLNELLTPRVSMAKSFTHKSTSNVKPPSVPVEVTKDGPAGDAVCVGKFLLYRDSDPHKVAARFAKLNKLTPSQQTRLELQLQENIKSAF